MSGGAFSGAFVPPASGEYRLALASANGAPLAGDTVRLAVRVVADSVPAVEIPVPGADTLAPLSLKVPLVVDVRDDYGITAVAVVSRRISRLGTVGHLARMVVFALVGAFLVKAAVEFRGKTAVGLDGALAKIQHQPYGHVLLGIVAAGLIAFALYSVSDARYRRI